MAHQQQLRLARIHLSEDLPHEFALFLRDGFSHWIAAAPREGFLPGFKLIALAPFARPKRVQAEIGRDAIEPAPIRAARRFGPCGHGRAAVQLPKSFERQVFRFRPVSDDADENRVDS